MYFNNKNNSSMCLNNNRLYEFYDKFFKFFLLGYILGL